ncbi:plasmid recombination protein [Neiella marina]|uniref:Plasmid recombination protein n=1 Tax=Neiella holothuriorum TaxID=2870530 RepID=A0ABS7EHX5_9GAMM|nr:MobV family relaxase [Neiella holothuriorum]MBW8191941.1 plasmid recombination protein [Neiella holothuriorum]
MSISSSFAILRLAKIKTFGALAACSAHIGRHRNTPNANSGKAHLNRVRIGSGNITHDVKQHIASKGIQKLRSNGVLAVELVLTFSPEWLKTSDGQRYRARASQDLREWEKANLTWLRQTFGDRVVSYFLHMDERTPHVHVLLVPTYEKATGKFGMSARRLFGGKQKLSELQSSYAAAMKNLGLHRGRKGSKATHQKLADFYAQLNEAARNCEALGLPVPTARSPLSFANWQRSFKQITQLASDENNERINSLKERIRQLSDAYMALSEYASFNSSTPKLGPRLRR